MVKKLLAFNDAQTQRVEVVILSRNDPVSGMRVFRSAQHYGLPIQRGSFTRGQSPWRYLKPLNANLFLSTHLSDVRAALDAGVPAAQVYPHSAPMLTMIGSAMLPEAAHLSSPNMAGFSTLVGFVTAVGFKLFE